MRGETGDLGECRAVVLAQVVEEYSDARKDVFFLLAPLLVTKLLLVVLELREKSEKEVGVQLYCPQSTQASVEKRGAFYLKRLCGPGYTWNTLYDILARLQQIRALDHDLELDLLLLRLAVLW